MLHVLIADDHALVREGLIRFLSTMLHPVQFGEAATAHEAFNMVQKKQWDLLLLDVSLPDRNGLDVLKDIKSRHNNLPVLVVSMHPEDQFAVRAFRAGASGYITKDAPNEELERAVRKVLAGGKYVSALLAESMAAHLNSTAPMLPHEALSDREYEILCLIGAGLAVSEIAQRLSLSVKTVSTHRAHILVKTCMHNNAELMHYVVQHGLVSGDERHHPSGRVSDNH